MPSSTGNAGSKRRTSEANSDGSTKATTGAAAAVNGKVKVEAFHNDRESFLEAFEKPTQIYRFLRSRMIESPTFLQRNLTYRKMLKPKGKKKGEFRVDSILEKLEKKMAVVEEKPTTATFMNFILTGVKDCDNIWAQGTNVKIEFKIGRATHRKRKDSQGSMGRLVVIVEETRELLIKPDALTQCPCVSIPVNQFLSLVDGAVVSELHLFIKATFLESALVKNGVKAGDMNSANGDKTTGKSPKSINNKPQGKNSKDFTKPGKTSLHVNNHSSKSSSSDHPSSVGGASSDSEDQEPKRKRRRVSTKERDDFVYDSTLQKKIHLVGHLTLSDKDTKLILENTDYELLLKEHHLQRKYKRMSATWEILQPMDQKSPGFPFDCDASKCPRAKLTISVRTSQEALAKTVDRPTSISKCCSIPILGLDESWKLGGAAVKKEKFPIVYQFLYNNNSRQQTEARDDLRCPWCSLNCWNLYCLLKHLKLCHPRFHFSYVPLTASSSTGGSTIKGARIDVSINKSFDGSYAGSAYDLVAQPPGDAFARNGPSKRTNIFSILVCHPMRSKPNIQEFLENEEEKETEPRRTYVTGHNRSVSKISSSYKGHGVKYEGQRYKWRNFGDKIQMECDWFVRLYHHTSTCLPIHPKEIDVDSEGETDPEWLRIKTSMMIDEFTDVNEGEKELMKMWNLHVLKYNYVGDCQIPLACNKFVELQGKEVIKKNLYRNFILHLSSLFDFGLLDAKSFFTVVQLLQSQMKENNTAASLRRSWKENISQSQKPSTSKAATAAADAE